MESKEHSGSVWDRFAQRAKQPKPPRMEADMDDGELLSAALTGLETVLSADRDVQAVYMRRLGKKLQKRLSAEASAQVWEAVNRLGLTEPGRGYATAGEAAVELYRMRSQVSSVSSGADGAASGRGGSRRLLRALVSLRRTSLALAVCLAVLGAGVALYFLFPGGIFLRTVEVPELRGTNIRETVPDESLFRLEATYRYDSGSEAGTILSQTPSAGMLRRVERGRHPCVIQVSVSLGQQQVEVGDYAGMSEHAARVECRRLGLIVKRESVSDHPRGNVAYTDPPAGTVLPAGASVTLYVGSAYRVAAVSLPSLVGVSEAAACSMLASLGLTRGNVTYIASDKPAGVVVAQSVLAGTELDAGSRVGLVVSKGCARGAF